LFIKIGKYEDAISCATADDIQINEDFVESFVSNLSPEQRKPFYIKIGDACIERGHYSLASKVYTQGGDRLNAIKALLKQGDTDKIITYANTTKNREIYIIAANYLQTLNWKSNSEYLKLIIHFYTKAKAKDFLFRFYESYAESEIDELREALKYSEKETPSTINIREKLSLIDRFVNARQLAVENLPEMIKICQELVQDPDVDKALRPGDIFGSMVEAYYANKDFENAFILLSKMERMIPNLEYFLDKSIIQAIKRANGIDNKVERNEEEIEEEIIEEIE
jgi:intraflagellar transport protein 140